MKKLHLNIFSVALLITLLAVPIGSQSWKRSEVFITTPTAGIAVGTSATVTNGTDFTSAAIWVSRLGYSNVVGLTFTFTRVAGSTSTLDYYFQVSYDNGTTWANYDDIKTEIATNTAIITGTTVRVYKLFNTHGASHWKLWKIENNDGSNAVTAANVTLSHGR